MLAIEGLTLRRLVLTCVLLMSPGQAQGFDMATATKWTSELLSEFCATADFELGFVPDEALLIPPQQNFFVDHHELETLPQSNPVDAFASAPSPAGRAEVRPGAPPPTRRALFRCCPVSQH